jgi:hypothetical protein
MVGCGYILGPYYQFHISIALVEMLICMTTVRSRFAASLGEYIPKVRWRRSSMRAGFTVI